MDNYMLSKNLKNYFKNNIKIVIKSIDKVFLITKNDIFYEINIFDQNLQSWLSCTDNSMIEKYAMKELCNKKITDLAYGMYHYIAKSDDSKIYCWGNNYLGQLGNGKRDEDTFSFNKPELNEFLSELNIISIKCGLSHSIALTASGEVFEWGWNTNFPQLIPIKVEGFDTETVIEISCGFDFSLACTKTGRVFSWGNNKYGQLGIHETDGTEKPKLIELNDNRISKISCGPLHSFLLSNDGSVYVFGNKSLGQFSFGTTETKIKPTKIDHEKKFIDIASHWNENISIALSIDNVYYVWDKYRENILAPIEKKCKSFNDIFVNHSEYNSELSEESILFTDISFQNGYYERNFTELHKIGEGGNGTVFKIMVKNDEKDVYAVKKINSKIEYKFDILREFHTYYVATKLLNENVVNHFNAWIEKSESNDEIILYIIMDLCDETLRQMIDEIKNDSNFKKDNKLTPIGYHILSQLFIEILEGVQNLHKHNIIHRDLNPSNIMLKRNEKNKRFIRIVDFGLIAIHESVDQKHSSDKGNFDYIAPEVFYGGKYDTKADIYSLGILLRELFDIKDNESDEENNFIPELKYKYIELIEISGKMTQMSPELRPTCEQILRERQSWSLNEEDFQFEIPLKNILKSQSENEFSFIHSILESKLIEIIDFGMKDNNLISMRESVFTKILPLLMHRPSIVMRCLFHLNDYTLSFCESSSHLIEVLVIVMRKNTNIANVQLNAIKCLFNLTKDKLVEKMPSKTIEEVVEVTLTAMELFPNHRQLYECALKIFRNQHILEEISFNKYKFMQLLMNSFINFKDEFLNDLVIKLCIVLVDELSMDEKLNLRSSPDHMQSLLDLIRSRVQNSSDNDEILELYLVFLWSLTDGSIEICKLFIEEEGLDLYIRILCERFGKYEIEARVLASLNNIAEFSHLRIYLKRTHLLNVLRNLMYLSQNKVSYFATSILANLCSDGPGLWSDSVFEFEDILTVLEDVVLNWGTPNFIIIEYVPFSRLLPLLNCLQGSAIHLFAIWTLHHISFRNPGFFRKMILSEIGIEVIQTIFERSKADNKETLAKLCEDVLDLIIL